MVEGTKQGNLTFVVGTLEKVRKFNTHPIKPLMQQAVRSIPVTPGLQICRIVKVVVIKKRQGHFEE